MFSIRMRAEKNKKHISGAENLVDIPEIQTTVSALVERALSHEKGEPDLINITVESLKTPIKKVTSLPLILANVENEIEGKILARKLLRELKIPALCVEKSISLLEKGPANGENMRGAIIMDLKGNRIEPDRIRGIRASRMDITDEASNELFKELSGSGLSSYFKNISEALILATKVASVKGTVAELCWSDDPSYTAGYVASQKMGYIRISHLKKKGGQLGGRVFFVDDIDHGKYITEIEKTPVLVNKFGGIVELIRNQIKI
ncbi:MAG: 6-carboxyhexanoate--CoA ligase [Candidatus Methanoperedens sp.]|nr:6-carboxyhexanoate--CoA ligase [Candidatus Methanoperedens sp.]